MSTEELNSTEKKIISCGLVMPISAIDGYTAEHWIEVKNIITDAIEGITEQNFTVKLVSDADDAGVIQKRIVHNLYSSDIVICDVSAKNPNVMFELGMRLAFDKPTVIVKDDKTDYSFDTGIIEHIPYPRDLRFAKIVTFKNTLADKINGTYKSSITDSNHSTFLKNFGDFHVAKITELTVPADKLIFEMLGDLQRDVTRLRRTMSEDEFHKSKNKKTNVFTLNQIYEGSIRIRREIESYREVNPEIRIRDLLNNNDFYSWVEARIEPGLFYKNQEEFCAAISNIIIEMISTLE
jgi:hypothetical protein